MKLDKKSIAALGMCSLLIGCGAPDQIEYQVDGSIDSYPDYFFVVDPNVPEIVADFQRISCLFGLGVFTKQFSGLVEQLGSIDQAMSAFMDQEFGDDLTNSMATLIIDDKSIKWAGGGLTLDFPNGLSNPVTFANATEISVGNIEGERVVTLAFDKEVTCHYPLLEL